MLKAHQRIDKLERAMMLPDAASLLPSGVFVVTVDDCDVVPSEIGARRLEGLSKLARGVVIIVHAAPK